MTISEAYQFYRKRIEQLEHAGAAAIICNDFFEYLAGIDKSYRNTRGNELWNNSNEELMQKAIQRLAANEPVQYITGVTWFYNRKFHCSPAALIPRPETEELAELIIKDKDNFHSVLDIGTGTGCIAITLKKELSNAELTALDKSSEALALAKKNAADLDATINFIETDFLSDQIFELPTYDLIVSNPPYIPETEKKNMEAGVVDFEPAIALFVPASEPLIFYKQIALFAEKHLLAEGKVFLETHFNNAADVAELFNKKKYKSELMMDMSGKERFVKITRFR